jgi:hypothetical protein
VPANKLAPENALKPQPPRPVSFVPLRPAHGSSWPLSGNSRAEPEFPSLNRGLGAHSSLPSEALRNSTTASTVRRVAPCWPTITRRPFRPRVVARRGSPSNRRVMSAS